MSADLDIPIHHLSQLNINDGDNYGDNDGNDDSNHDLNDDSNINNLKKKRKPFLKWAGGKTQILDKILDKFPKKIKNYHEPFIGGGSVLLGLLCKISNGEIKLKGKIFVYDLNPFLINLYNHIKNNKDDLLIKIQFYMARYTECDNNFEKDQDKINRKPTNEEEAATSKESYFYWLRKIFNEKAFQKKEETIEISALFIVLNKLCFRGIYREGPNGFNVPFGHYKTVPNVLSEEDLNIYYLLFQNVEFKRAHFKESIINAKKGDLVYLDPPYAPENETSFVGYTKDGFEEKDHKELFKLINNLHQKKIKFILSNADVPLVNSNFSNPEYTTERIECRRACNSKNPGAKTSEVIIHNYE
jgi:DNA adenine methylase